MTSAWLISMVLAGLVAFIAVIMFTVVRKLRRNAAAAGYPGVFAYLRAVPRNDEEKRQAVDLTLKGVVMCVLGLFFPPMILIGVVPLYYGGRKLLLVRMGLDLMAEMDAGDHSRA